jgi:hypothetical protein
MKLIATTSIAMFFVLATGVASAIELPDSTKTPGVPLHTVPEEAAVCISHLMGKTVHAGQTITREIICTDKYTTCVRDVKEDEKKKVYENYGLAGDHTGYCSGAEGCEIDHLISLELGGANDIKNLWPQPYEGAAFTAHMKDTLERRMHKMVCEGDLSLDEAQKEIRTNWIEAYKKHLKK